MHIRIAKTGDAGKMLSIYAPYISGSAVSFETEVPSVSEFRRRIKNYMLMYPWLVCVSGDEIAGYAYASAYRDREAYRWSCECSVYIEKKFQKKGIARQLYAVLFEILKLQGLVNVYAVITFPNRASIAFHTAAGFRSFAVYKNAGCKFGKWHDVHWMKKQLHPYKKNPKVPVAFSKFKDNPAVHRIIARHNLLLK